MKKFSEWLRDCFGDEMEIDASPLLDELIEDYFEWREARASRLLDKLDEAVDG